MSTDSVAEVSSFARYISAVRAVWGDGKNPELPHKVQGLMQEFLATADWNEPWLAELVMEAKVAKEMYRDPDYGFIQMGHVQPQGHNNPPHDHGPCWVVYGAYSGLTEIVLYRNTGRKDDAGRTVLEKRELQELGPGVVYPYLPGDVHSVVALKGPAVIFRFLSYDLTKVKRGYYDLETNATVVDRSATAHSS